MAVAAAMESPVESVMEASVKEATVEMVEAIAEDAASAGEEGRPVAPGIRPIVGVRIRRDGDRLCRQRVDLER